MTDFATEPMLFSGAKRFLDQKVSLPTTMSSLEIGLKLPAKIRGQSFISAKVASAHILDGLRAEVDLVASGQINYSQARERLKMFLAKQGVGIHSPGSKEDKDITSLGSTSRLNLILRQNVAMAHAVGQREVSENPAVMEYFPNYEYLAEDDGKTRAEHRRFNGLILPKTDPFWKTHFPPWEFNCRCMALSTDSPVNGKSAGWKSTPEGAQIGMVDFNGPHNVLPNQSGFVFASDPAEAFLDPDFSSIDDPDLRSQVEDSWNAKKLELGLEEYRQKKAADAASAAAAEADRRKAEEDARRRIESDPGLAGADSFGARLTKTADSVGGSTGAFVVQDDAGQKWVVKNYSGNELQVQNEWIANRLYSTAGITVPDMRLARVEGKLAVASKMIDGLKDVGSGGVDAAAKTPAVKRGFVMDAWLANWDVAGLGFDNVLARAGSRTELYRVDQGGAMMFRAQGTPKGTAWGTEVSELWTMRDGSNQQSARLFAGVTDEDIQKQIGVLGRKIKLKTIDQVIQQSGLTGSTAKELKATLKARLNWLKQWKPAAADPGLPAKSAPAGDSDESLVKTIAAARLNGLTVPTDAREIEDHNVRFWHETNRAGQPVTKANLKLRDSAAQKVNASVAKAGLKPVWDSNDLGAKVITAIRGIASRAAKGEPIDPKDVTRVIEVETALQAARKALEKAIQDGHYGQKALSDFDSHYRPWLDALNKATAAGASTKATWTPPSKKLFAEFSEPARLSKKITGALSWTKGSELTAKDIQKGHAKETDTVIFSNGHYYETEMDGVRVRFWSDEPDVPFALRNTMEISAPGQDVEAVRKTYKTMGEIGVPKDRSTALDREELYLHQIAYHRRDQYDEVKKIAAIADQAERVRKMREIVSTSIGKDVATLPGYNPDGRFQAFGQGCKFMFRPDLQGKDWEKFKAEHAVYHRITNGSMTSAIEQILNSGGQMAPTVDKLRRGIKMGGMSPDADLGTGGASYFFTRIKKASAAASAEGLVWSPQTLARLDSISYESDYFGKVDDGESGIQKRRKTGITEWNNCAKKGSNETIFKNGISIFDDLISINCSNDTERNRVLKLFRDHGYSVWPDGRKLEDVVRVT